MSKLFLKIFLPALIVYFGFIFFTYQYYDYSSGTLDQEVENRIHTLGLSVQLYLESNLDSLSIFEEEMEKIDELLENIENKFSLENISLSDNLFQIIASTNPFIDVEEIQKLSVTIDEKKILKSEQLLIRKILSTETSNFKTMLIPLEFGSDKGTLMIDVNMDYLKSLQKFKLKYFYGLIASIILFFGFLIIVWIILKRLHHSQLEKENQEKLALMGKMSASIAHEIKNPLGIIKSTAQLIEKKYGNEQDEIFEYIYDEIDRLDKSINNYLTFSKDLVIEPESLDINQHVRRVVNDFPEIICEEEEVGSYFYDSFRLTQLLRNLILNAQKYGKEPIRVLIKKNGKDCLIQVTDNGPGIPSQNMIQIFEAFSTSSKSGTGLGLNICKKIAELHGGEIYAENLSSGGACLSVIIKKDFDENSVR